MANQRVRLRGVRGKPLAEKAKSPIPLTRSQLQLAGRMILAEVKKEIAKDQAKALGIRPEGSPVQLPLTKSFAESFKYRIVGESTIEITSSWPTAEAHTTHAGEVDSSGKPLDSAPIRMDWLVQPKVRIARMELTSGQVVFRMTPDPSKGDSMWVHPGFKRYTFIERGVRKGREKFVEKMMPEMIKSILSSTDIFGGR